MPDKNGIPSPIHYFRCTGCTPPHGTVISRETFYRIKPADGSDRAGRFSCPKCNSTWHHFEVVPVDEEPRTNEEFGDQVDRYEDLMVHSQGEDEWSDK